LHEEGDHTAIAIRYTIKHTGEISSLHKIFVAISFGKRLYCM